MGGVGMGAGKGMAIVGVGRTNVVGKGEAAVILAASVTVTTRGDGLLPIRYFPRPTAEPSPQVSPSETNESPLTTPPHALPVGSARDGVEKDCLVGVGDC